MVSLINYYKFELKISPFIYSSCEALNRCYLYDGRTILFYSTFYNAARNMIPVLQSVRYLVY